MIRREALLSLGQAGLGALTLPKLLAAERAFAAPGGGLERQGLRQRAKSCIFLFLWGGPPQQDLWDLKPEAPGGIRSVLDETLVVLTGEFGRTPKINAANGRDHWGPCYTTVLAGGGIRGGQVYGASDRDAAFPKSSPVAPEDILATIYEALGISGATEISDNFGRPFTLCTGQPVTALF